MPRLQILPLPEVFVGEASETPFVLVIDQADEAILQRLAFGTTIEVGDGNGNGTTTTPTYEYLKQQLGARAILVFADTIEIPANDVSAYAPGPVDDVHLDVEGNFPKFGPPNGGEPLTDPDRIPGRYA
ncbi:hypothetical protein [Streptomyces sp. NPDC006285]|uniref:hypothetical protein n=1 Tax=Streptomyces sp. NPDC006285 TaxID=3364742 RepID=UPI00368F3E47